MHRLYAFILLVVLQNASAHSGSTGENIGRRHGYTARDIIRAIEREVVQEHLGSAGSSGSANEELHDSSTDSTSEDVSGLPSHSRPVQSQLDSTVAVATRGTGERPATNNHPPSTNQGEGFRQPTIYRGESDYKDKDDDDDNDDDDDDEGRSTSEEESETENKSPRMEFAHIEKVADVMKRLKEAKTDEEMASKLRTGAKQVMHSIVDDMVTKTTQTVEPKIGSIVDRGLKSALANNASHPASLVEKQTFDTNTTENALYNRETEKVQNVNNPVNSKSRRTTRNSKPTFKSSKNHFKKTRVTAPKSNKASRGPITTVVSFISGKKHSSNSSSRRKSKQSKKRTTTTSYMTSTANKEKDIKTGHIKHKLGKIKESEKDKTKDAARETDQSEGRNTKTKTVVEGPSQGDSVKKELVAQDREPMNSAAPGVIDRIGEFPRNENRRLVDLQNKVDRIENELTILQTAVAGVINRLDDMGRVVQEVSNLTEQAVLGPYHKNQKSSNNESPLGGRNASVIKIILPPFKSQTTNITGLKLGISEPTETQEKIPNVSAPNPKITETGPPGIAPPSVEELFPEIKGSSGLPLPQTPISVPKDKEIPTDMIAVPGSGNSASQLPVTNLSSEQVELLPNGGLLNLTDSLQGTEAPTHAPIEPLPGSNGMLVNKTQNTNNKHSGKSSGNHEKDDDKTHNLYVTESPTHTTMEPLPGTGGRTNESQNKHSDEFSEHHNVEPNPETGESGLGNSLPTQEADQQSGEGMTGADQSYEVNNEPYPGINWTPGNFANVPTPGTEIEGPTPEPSSDKQGQHHGSQQEAPIPTPGQEEDSDNPLPTPGSEPNSDNESPTPGTESASDNTASNSESNKSGKNMKENPSGIDQSEISVNTGRFPEAQSDMFQNQLPFPIPGPFPVQSPFVPPYFMRFQPEMGMRPTPHTPSSPHQVLIPVGSLNGFQPDDDNSDSENSDDADERHNVHNYVNRNRNAPVSAFMAGKYLKIENPKEPEVIVKSFAEKDRQVNNVRGKQMIGASQANQETASDPAHGANEEQKVAMDTPQEDQKANDVRPIINIIVPNSETATLLSKEMCQPPCKNGGKCVGINTCKCPTLFLGDQCDHFSLMELLKKNRNRPSKQQYDHTMEKYRSLQHRPVTIEELLRSLVRRYRLPRHRQQVNNPATRDNINYRYNSIREPLSYRFRNEVNSNAYRYHNIRVPNYYRFQNEGTYYDPSEKKKSIIPRKIQTRINPITKRKQYILEV